MKSIAITIAVLILATFVQGQTFKIVVSSVTQSVIMGDTLNVATVYDSDSNERHVIGCKVVVPGCVSLTRGGIYHAVLMTVDDKDSYDFPTNLRISGPDGSVVYFYSGPFWRAAQAQTVPPQKCLAVYPVGGNQKSAAFVGAMSLGIGLIGMHGEYFIYVGSAGLSIADTKPKYHRKDLVKLENAGVHIIVNPTKQIPADVHVTVGSDDVTNPCLLP